MRNFFRAFVYAWNGILHASNKDRNFKVHLIATIIVMSTGLLTGLTQLEWFIVIILIAGMLSLEMVNAAIERVVDLVTSEHHPLAGLAKDLAAGAVLIFAITSAIIGLMLFIPKWF